MPVQDLWRFVKYLYRYWNSMNKKELFKHPEQKNPPKKSNEEIN